VIHLAAFQNDPSFELNPEPRQIDQLDAFILLVKEAKDAG